VPDPKNPERIPAAQADISLSQTVLSLLQSIVRANNHAQRGAVTEFLQLGFPARPAGAEPPKDPVTGEVLPDKPYTMDFLQEQEEGGVLKRRILRMPTLALFPAVTLAVKSASFKLDMAVQSIERSVMHTAGNKDTDLAASPTRPWFLVHEPVELKGHISSSASEQGARGERRNEQRIQIEVQVEQTPLPAGMAKLITSLTQSASTRELPPLPPPTPSPEKP
jgi:hypothetical protein